MPESTHEPVRPPHAFPPDRGALEQYLVLYKAYLDRMIQWSEVELLDPRYLHLHEQDMRVGGRYKMWQYLAGFVRQLGDFARRFKKLLFCHSWEAQSRLRPAECKREKFFYYELENVAGSRLREIDFRYVAPDNPGSLIPGPGRMEPIPIEPGLRDLLLRTDWIQTYILGYASEERELRHHVKLVRVSPEAVDKAVAAFVTPDRGGYQFTIFGYQLTDSSVDFTDAERAFLEHVFLVHVMIWNIELRTADLAREYLLAPVERARDAWEKGRRQLDILRTAVQDAISHIETVASVGAAEPPGELILPVDDSLNRELFDEPHKLADFRAQALLKLPSFWEKIKGTGDREVRDIMTEFGIKCGVLDCLRAGDDVAAADRETWSTAIWWAYKLLTRRLMESEPAAVVLGPDQLLLALLKGLATSQGAQEDLTIGVRVTYRGLGFAERDEFCKALKISNPSSPRRLWQRCDWRIAEEPGPRLAFTARWDYPAGGPVPHLVAFLRAGLLRDSDSAGDRAVRLRVPRQSEESAFACSNFLRHLAKLVAELAYPERDDYVRMRAIRLLYEVIREVVGEERRTVARARVELECAGSPLAVQNLRQSLVKRGKGQLNLAWTGLLTALGQDNRGFIDDGRWTPGLALRGEGNDPVVVALTLESERETI
jgi:hypothetical protein